MKKKLNAASIQSELAAQSVFFQKKTPAPASSPKEIEPATSNHDTVIPRNHDTTLLEEVRKATKEFGKEAATHRFTQEEKRAITEIIYHYKQEGIRTSENEIVRIATNWLIQDHRKEKSASFLDKALNAIHK